jgi:hypothetical protein
VVGVRVAVAVLEDGLKVQAAVEGLLSAVVVLAAAVAMPAVVA